MHLVKYQYFINYFTIYGPTALYILYMYKFPVGLEDNEITELLVFLVRPLLSHVKFT